MKDTLDEQSRIGLVQIDDLTPLAIAYISRIKELLEDK